LVLAVAAGLEAGGRDGLKPVPYLPISSGMSADLSVQSMKLAAD
jgi:hypothetical protein